MPHVTGHSPHGGSTIGPVGMGSAPPEKKINPYKQAAQSMMSAGISSVSGSTTSDDKGKKAKKIQKDYRSNQNKDSIVPKPKPKPDEKKEFRVTVPGQDPDLDDRPKSKGIMKKDDALSPLRNTQFDLKYDMSLSGEKIPGLMETDYSFSPMIQDETFTEKVERYIYNNIPEPLHNTVGASYAIATAAVEQEYTFDSGVTLDWKDDMTIMIDILKLLEDK